jgi:hypothetical protein
MIYLIIYTIGFVLSYVLLKKEIKGISGEWIKGIRAAVLFISLFSWLSVIASLCLKLEKSNYFNEDAKW